MLALYFGRMRHLSSMQGIANDRGVAVDAGHRSGETLRCHGAVQRIAEKYHSADNMLYMGRQYLFPVALGRGLEAQGDQLYPRRRLPGRRDEARPDRAGGRETPSVFLVPRGPVFDKVMSNLEEVKARGGPVIAIASGE